MSKPRRVPRWMLIALLFGGGTLFQTTGCNEIYADLTTGLLTSITDNFISTWMNQRFRVPTFNLGGLTT